MVICHQLAFKNSRNHIKLNTLCLGFALISNLIDVWMLNALLQQNMQAENHILHPSACSAALSLTVIFIGNGISDQSSNPGWSQLCFTLCHYSWERHKSLCSLSRDRWIVGKTGYFSLSKATNPGERNLWIQTNCTLFTNWLFVAFCLWWKGWENTYSPSLVHHDDISDYK